MTGPVRFMNSDAQLGPDEIFFISYPLEKYLLNYLSKGVLWRNTHFRRDWQVCRPLFCAIGSESTFNALHETLSPGDRFTCSQIAYFSRVTQEELTEFLYEKLVRSAPPFILLHGVNAIQYSVSLNRTIEQQLDLFVSDIQKLQAQFKIPVLLSGTCHVKNGDDNYCRPFLDHPSDFVLPSNSHYDIVAPVGSYKLFKLAFDMKPAGTTNQALDLSIFSQ